MHDDTGALVRRAQAGDREAFHRLAQRYLRAMYAVTLAHLRRPADAEDAAQDACVQAFSKIDTCHEPERFGAWIVQIARNRALTLLQRRRLRDVPRHEVDSERSVPIPNPNLSIVATRAELLSALEELGDTEREALLLCDLEGWSHREIAEGLGISETASRQHVFVARRKVRERLGREDP